MHVLLIHQAFASLRQPGGTRHFEFGAHVVRRGHRFSVISGSHSYMSGDKAGREVEELPDGLQIWQAYALPCQHRSYFWRVISFLSFMMTSVWAACRVRRIDLVMATTPPIFQTLSAWAVSVLRRKPLLLEVRDLWPEFAVDIGLLKNPVLIWLARRLERFLYRQADHVLVNSPAYVKYLHGCGVPNQKITLIPNGVDPAMFATTRSQAEVRDPWDLRDKFVITYAGALGLANDLDTLLQAAALLQDCPAVQFLIVGEGKERHRLETLAKTLGLRNVTFAGARPKSDIPWILAMSHVCVATLRDIPMFRMTYPNKVFDYMAAGRPTVLGIDGVIREVMDAASGGICVPPGNAPAIAAAIRELFLDSRRREELGRRAREYVCRHFDRATHADDFCGLMTRLTDKPGRLITPAASGLYQRHGKRLFDILASCALLLILSPALAIVALLVRWNLGSPVFFRQLRPGRHGHPFRICKFRTMIDARDPAGELLQDSQRLTRLGRWLRSTSLDELPELWNVLLGHMSLVGPRPLLMQYLDRYTEQQARRHEVRPGVTGLAQISGRQLIPFSKRLELDVQYIDGISPRVDLKILFLSVVRVITGAGVKSGQDVADVDDIGLSAPDALTQQSRLTHGKGRVA